PPLHFFLVCRPAEHFCRKFDPQHLLTCGPCRGTMAQRGESGGPAAVQRNRTTMATDHIRYDVLARDALRGVLRRLLTDAAEHGLPGEHHFFITFLSTADGVKLSPRLLAQYPEEMTIILQPPFWD